MTSYPDQRLDLSDYPTLIEFRGFPKIPRLNREIIITEKIDGTNAQVLVTEDGQVIAGSRKRYLTVENDNFGFAAWVAEHKEELLQLGPGRHFGEWWGQGINRNYGLDHKRFSLFNVKRWLLSASCCPDPDKEIEEANKEAPSCCDIVPILAHINFDITIINATLNYLYAFGSRAAPGFMKPEGIVIYHKAGNCFFKVTLENDDKPKEKNDDSETP